MAKLIAFQGEPGAFSHAASHALFPEQPKAVTQAIASFARRIYGM